MSKYSNTTGSTNKYNIIYRRFFIIGFIKIVAFLVLIGRFIFLQVFKHQFYSNLANANKRRQNVIQPTRGNIFDRNNIKLTKNIKYYQVEYSYNGQPEQVSIQTINAVFKLIDSKLYNNINFIKRIINKTKQDITKKSCIAKYLKIKDIIKINYFIDRLPNISINKSNTRHYTTGKTNAHITGYISIADKQDLIQKQLLDSASIDSQNINFLNAKVGKSGIEKKYNNHLFGEFGQSVAEINSSNRIISKSIIKNPKEGKDITLTIDSEIQKYIEDQFRRIKHNGSCIVIDIETGEVVAMQSFPSFEPNDITKGTVIDELKSNTTIESQSSFFNKCINMLMPIGSAIKPFVTLVALEAKNPYHGILNCTGSLKVGNRVFHCHKTEGHGKVDLVKALAVSCNTVFYKIATQISPKDIEDVAQKIQLTDKSNIEFDNEKVGQIFNKSRKWISTGDVVNVSIGQGDLLMTPMQIALLAAKIASGKIVKPTIIKGSNDKIDFEKIDLKEESLSTVRASMREVFIQNKADIFNIKMCGKTGTSQVVSKNFTKEELPDVPKNLRPHSLFMGYAPFDKPKYAIATVVDNGTWGSLYAMPLSLRIMNKTIKKYSK